MKFEGKIYNSLEELEELAEASLHWLYQIEESLENAEFIVTYLPNPENKQHLIPTLILEKDWEGFNAMMELTLVDEYYDWSDTIANKVYSSEDWQDYIEEYNQTINIYNALLDSWGDMEESKLDLLTKKSKSHEDIQDIVERYSMEVE